MRGFLSALVGARACVCAVCVCAVCVCRVCAVCVLCVCRVRAVCVLCVCRVRAVCVPQLAHSLGTTRVGLFLDRGWHHVVFLCLCVCGRQQREVV